MYMRVLSVATAVGLAAAQHPGPISEGSPPLVTSFCTLAGGCVPQQKSITVDANWRWYHGASGSNCYDGNSWDSALCPDPTTCIENCVLEGVSEAGYRSTYGISTTDDSLTLDFITEHAYGKNVGSRTYLLNGAGDGYEMFRLKNTEFTFDVDVSALVCGLNGALYFVQMDEDGGASRFGGNTAGAKYGTGYCDAQAPPAVPPCLLAGRSLFHPLPRRPCLLARPEPSSSDPLTPPRSVRTTSSTSTARATSSTGRRA